jgi:hydrogenase maturation factor HypF (carbamoyltransferase family)
LTDVQAPADNSGADAVRLNQPLQTNANGAYYEFTLTIAESKSLTVGATYMAEVQLKQSGTVVVTPVTGKTKVLQDYIV